MITLKVGTRSSILARTQTKLFTDALKRSHPEVHIQQILIQTDGDISTTPLSQAKTPGIFVSALREALLENQVHLIVHSMKDLPAKEHPLIVAAAIPSREDVRDVLVSKNDLPLEQLSKGAKIGTSSPRRTASIRRLRPDLEIIDIRGNVDSRIKKVRSGSYEATILARAGLNRIGRGPEASQLLPVRDFLPAPGQGALSVEVLAAKRELLSLVASLDDPHTRLTTTAERSILTGLKATCATAIGALAEFNNGQMTLMAELADPLTGDADFVSKTISLQMHDLAEARDLGIELANELLAGAVAKRTGLS